MTSAEFKAWLKDYDRRRQEHAEARWALHARPEAAAATLPQDEPAPPAGPVPPAPPAGAPPAPPAPLAAPWTAAGGAPGPALAEPPPLPPLPPPLPQPPPLPWERAA